MRKFILLSITALTMAGCSASAGAAQLHATPTTKVVAEVVKGESFNILTDKPTLTLLQKDIIHKNRLIANTKRVDKVLKQLKTYAGRTWYVFSGSTPSGWDCSGLVRWTYEQLGIELEHRASIQAKSGKRVHTPVPGDVVAFFYPGGTSAYHVGIYLGNGKMINAPRPGTRTAIEPVHTYRLKGSQIRYVRFIEQSRGN